jgi:3-deoxy-manno-octulosonate cytidylyltransferase (CMP-KDO synthetase)
MTLTSSDKIPAPLRFVGIIPARFASTRFPGKPLVDIGGKSMIQRVYEQVSKVLPDVYVATDDSRIYDAVLGFGGKAIMTSDQHKSGTDRCYEAFTKLSEWFDVVINVQGDEPFIQSEQIVALKECFNEEATEIGTLVKKISIKESESVLFNPNSPKVVIDKQNFAMYFSRSTIPYKRGTAEKEWILQHDYYKHIGIYAYRADALKKLTSLEQSPLEIAESLEQLRWLENGFRIKVGFSDVETIGIDTPEDLEKVKELFI